VDLDVCLSILRTVEDEINNHVLFSLIWSIGAILEEESRKKYSVFLNELIRGKDVVKQY